MPNYNTMPGPGDPETYGRLPGDPQWAVDACEHCDGEGCPHCNEVERDEPDDYDDGRWD